MFRLAPPRCGRRWLGSGLRVVTASHTVLERLLDSLSYEAPDRDGDSIAIDPAYVDKHLGELVKDPDLSRYIL